MNPKRAPDEAPAVAPTQNRWVDDGIPRWDDGTPLDPSRFPEAYKRARERFAGWYIFPVNPLTPGFSPGTVPVRVPVFVP